MRVIENTICFDKKLLIGIGTKHGDCYGTFKSTENLMKSPTKDLASEPLPSLYALGSYTLFRE